MSFESRATALRAEVEFWIAVGEELLPVPCSLHYRVEQPYEFTATFHTGDTDVTWYLSRELVEAGLHDPAGDGDVRISPQRRGGPAPVLVFELRSEQGSATLQVELAAIADFLDQTFYVIPLDADYPWPDQDDLVSLAQQGWERDEIVVPTPGPARCPTRRGSCRLRGVQSPTRGSRVRQQFRPAPRPSSRHNSRRPG